MKEYKKFKKKDLIRLIRLLRRSGQTVRRNTYPGDWGISDSWSGNFDKLDPELTEILDWLEPMWEEDRLSIGSL